MHARCKRLNSAHLERDDNNKKIELMVLTMSTGHVNPLIDSCASSAALSILSRVNFRWCKKDKHCHGHTKAQHN